MREAKIICPMADNDGNSLVAAMFRVRDQMVLAFGGATISEAEGAWRGPNGVQCEPVWQMIAAYEPSRVNDLKLRAIALWFCERAKQHCVYTRFADGRVELVAPRNAEVAA